MSDESITRLGPEPIPLVEELLSRMTLREKLGQMTQQAYGVGDLELVCQGVERGDIGSFLNAGSLDTRNELQRLAVERTRLGIPLVFGRDVIHGFNTVFPIPLGQAASFDPALVERAAAVAAHEAAEAGVDWTFAPMVDVTRDPRWGRVAETCGEDAFLTATLGAAMVRGFQGKHPADGKHIAACAKHFAGYGASESGKDYNTTWIPEPLLRDVHLPPFKACVDAGVLSVMSAFNDLNGVPASVNAFLLQRVLKEEWAFAGLVVSDWAALMELLQHGVTQNPKQCAREGLHAGLDMEMATTTLRDYGAELVDEGSVPLALVDAAVRRILRVKHHLGLFHEPYKKAPAESVALSAPHLAVARELARESVVLLKNHNDLLPLDPGIRKLAVVGPLAADGLNQLGCWAFDGDAGASVTLKDALTARFSATEVTYVPGVSDTRSLDTSGFERAVQVVEDAEVAVVCLGEDALLSGEAKCRAFLDLPGAQQALLDRLGKTGTPLVVIVMAGRPLVLEPICPPAAALLYAWHPGTLGGEALTDLLTGEASPSGRLPISMPRAVGQIPVYYARRNTGRPPKADRSGVPKGTPLDPVDFESNYLDLEVSPLFPFGFGLSYTSFGYAELAVTPTRAPLGSRVTVSVVVSNRGSRRATETVQLYVRDLVASMTRPIRELKGFRRVELDPGEHRTLTFELGPGELAFTGRDLAPRVEPGLFQIWVGSDSNAELSATFELV
ncbi:MAG TPA: glycoside hydrolase family 3 N-terminal domain-containing protein [Polyangiaceae bacterium]|nr:glycoside hydrolase family 3 N-terminal domain-containing protein [Polyangiaceae bacterium]